MPTRWLIGLSCGSSADGVDAAVVETEGVGLELRARLVHFVHQPFGRELRDLALRVAGAAGEARQVSLLHRLLGETLAAAARLAADQASLSLQKVLCVGCAEHLAWHETEGRFPSLLPLGMPAVVAERTGLTTVSDLRARDLAAGGLGAPLGALPDYLLFRHADESRLLLHLGGVARFVCLPAGCRLPEVMGFEAGPCNHLLDALVRQLTDGQEAYDSGGKHAVQGRCDEALLNRWLAHPYFQRRPPKCLPRSAFGEEFARQVVAQARQQGRAGQDLLCTATHFVARAVTESARRFLAGRTAGPRVYLSGGGTRNGLLWRLLEQQLGGGLERTDSLGVAGSARKAVAAAALAALALDRVPGNVPSATGAAGSRLLGSFTPGSPGNWARCLGWMAAQATPDGARPVTSSPAAGW